MQYQDALLALAERTLRALPPASDAASSPPLGDAFRLGQLVCAGEYVAALRDALAARLLTADAAAAVEEYVLRPSPSAPFTVQPDHADGSSGRPELTIRADGGHAYGWMPAGQESDEGKPVIHRPDLRARVSDTHGAVLQGFRRREDGSMAVAEAEEMARSRAALVSELAQLDGRARALELLETARGGTEGAKAAAVERLRGLRQHEKELGLMVSRLQGEVEQLLQADRELEEVSGALAMLDAYIAHRQMIHARFLHAQRLRSYGVHVGTRVARASALAQRRRLREVSASEAALAEFSAASLRAVAFTLRELKEGTYPRVGGLRPTTSASPLSLTFCSPTLCFSLTAMVDSSSCCGQATTLRRRSRRRATREGR